MSTPRLEDVHLVALFVAQTEGHFFVRVFQTLPRLKSLSRFRLSEALGFVGFDWRRARYPGFNCEAARSKIFEVVPSLQVILLPYGISYRRDFIEVVKSAMQSEVSSQQDETRRTKRIRSQ
jgi:hypothetical protein